MENKLIIMIAEEAGRFKTVARIKGDADKWWKNQLKKNQARANSITNSNEIYEGTEDEFYYEWQLVKYLNRYKGLRNVEIKYI